MKNQDLLKSINKPKKNYKIRRYIFPPLLLILLGFGVYFSPFRSFIDKTGRLEIAVNPGDSRIKFKVSAFLLLEGATEDSPFRWENIKAGNYAIEVTRPGFLTYE